jgi:hypothetical protein
MAKNSAEMLRNLLSMFAGAAMGQAGAPGYVLNRINAPLDSAGFRGTTAAQQNFLRDQYP